MKIIKSNYKLIQGDCLVKLDEIKDKSIDLVIIDPPYNIGKANWDNIPNYTEWLCSIFDKLSIKLKENGSFYFFHNDLMVSIDLLKHLTYNNGLVFKQQIIWNKLYDVCDNENYLKGWVVMDKNQNYQKMCEYIFYFTKKPKFPDIMKYYMKKMNLTQKELSYLQLSKNNKPTGWISNKLNGKQNPTREQWKLLCNRFGIDDEYDNILPTFNNQKTHHSVWNYDIAKKQGHITPKPVPLIENILKHSSNKGDIVLDCFMGSGSTGVACKNLDRKFIGIELDEKYFKIAKRRIENTK